MKLLYLVAAFWERRSYLGIFVDDRDGDNLSPTTYRRKSAWRWGQPIINHVCKKECDNIAKQFLRFPAEGDLLEDLFTRDHHVTMLERTHDLAESLGRHFPDVAFHEVKLNVLDKKFFSLDLSTHVHIHDGVEIIEVVLTDQIVGQVLNVLTHVYPL